MDSTPPQIHRSNTSDPLITPREPDGGITASPPAGYFQTPEIHTDAASPQYASYRDAEGKQEPASGVQLMPYASPSHSSSSAGERDEKTRPWMDRQYAPGNRHRGKGDAAAGGPVVASVHPWIPVPLRTWFWVPLVLLMAGGGIGFEVALHFSQHNRGWGTNGDASASSGFMHYVYTLPPVAISMIFAGLWAWTDIEIRRLQPYVDLAQGDAPPQRSLLLDYTRNHTFYVWTIAAKNHHWLVSLGSLLVLITFGFQPLAAALFNVQDVFWTNPRVNVNSLAAIGLNQDENFQDLTSFLTAAGYASANVQYHFGDPEFTHGGYTVPAFELPGITNGTLVTNTTAILSQPNCINPDSWNMQQLGNGTWNNTATFGSCLFSFEVEKTTQHLFGSAPVNSSQGCSNLTAQPPQFRPVLFWFFSYDTTPPSANATMCSPSISLWDAEVTLDLASHNVTSVHPWGPLGSNNGTDPTYAQFAGNVTGVPLEGRAYNGLFFNVSDPDAFTVARQDAVGLMLPAAVMQAAIQSGVGLDGAFGTQMFPQLTVGVYTTYLALVARTVYFLGVNQPLAVDTMSFRKRLFLSPVAAHLLAIACFVLAIAGTVLHLWHRQERQVLTLAHAPGTIASAVALGGQTGVGNVLAGRLREEDMAQALQDKRFRIDTRTNKIVMEGEAGYEDAESPVDKLAFGLPRSLSVRAKRLSTGWVPRNRRASTLGALDE